MAQTSHVASKENNLNTYWMLVLSLVVGIIGGFGALIFRGMIGLVHNLSFDGKFSTVFNANVHPNRSVWGVGVIFVPVIGGLLVSWLTQKFAPEARGHGVPEVMDAIYYREGKIRPIVAVVKAIASSISIGTGGSVGREGPIIQIASAAASLLGQVIKMASRQRIVLIAAGAAAGIAATFNTPIGGLAFAIELMLVTISAMNVAIVAIATVTATMISHLTTGIEPSFYVPALTIPLDHALSPFIIVSFIPFGLLTGCAAALFIHAIYWFEDYSAILIKNPYFRHMLGMLALGLMLYLMMEFTNEYYVAGVGYATIMDILRGILSNPWFLLSLFFLKLLATCLTLGTGAAGGVFSPSLFMGVTLGAAYGGLLHFLFPHVDIPIVLFAITGMAAMVGGTTGAVLTAITMTFEQTRDYSDILPIMISVAITYAVRVKISNQSVYTLKLFRRGLLLPQGLQAAVSVTKRARNLMETNFALVDTHDINQWLQGQSGEATPHYAIVTENNAIKGMIRRELNYLLADVDSDKVINTSYVIVSATTSWPMLLRSMKEHNAEVVLVSRYSHSEHPEDIVGVITYHEIVQSSQQLAKLLQ